MTSTEARNDAVTRACKSAALAMGARLRGISWFASAQSSSKGSNNANRIVTSQAA